MSQLHVQARDPAPGRRVLVVIDEVLGVGFMRMSDELEQYDR